MKSRLDLGELPDALLHQPLRRGANRLSADETAAGKAPKTASSMQAIRLRVKKLADEMQHDKYVGKAFAANPMKVLQERGIGFKRADAPGVAQACYPNCTYATPGCGGKSCFIRTQ